jgi:hypothetical protein
MSRAVYTFFEKTNGQLVDQVEFDLFDNPGVRAWQCAVMLNSPDRTLVQRPTILNRSIVTTNVYTTYQQLKLAIKNLAQTRFAWKEFVPETFDQVDQLFMNSLHRHFTNSCYSLWDHKQVQSDNVKIDKILHEVNDLVHQLETYLGTDIKLIYGNTNTEIRASNDGRELGYDIFPFRHYHSYEPADLILDPYILGKTLIESFACNDDPSSWDTNGHMRTNGGSIMLLDTLRSKIYNSKEFIEWLNQYGLEKSSKLADFPLGNFVPGHRNKLEILTKHLHKYSVQVHIQL